jgi:hypothetical protein
VAEEEQHRERDERAAPGERVHRPAKDGGYEQAGHLGKLHRRES